MSEEGIAKREQRKYEAMEESVQGEASISTDEVVKMELDNQAQEVAAPSYEYTSLFTLKGHIGSVSSLAISPDGQQLVSSGVDGLLKIWSLATGAIIATLAASLEPEEDEENEEVAETAPTRLGICDVAWSRDGRYLICGGDDCIVRVWDATRHALIRQFTGHTSYVFCVKFHPNTSLAVSGSFDETVRFWNLQRNTCHRIISAHSEAVTAVDFNLDGSILASTSYDGHIRLWDSSTGQCLKTLVYGEAPSPIGSILFSPNSFQLLVTSLDNTIRLWDIANSRVVKTYLSHNNEKFAIKACFSAFTSSSTKFESSSSSTPLMIVAGSEDHRVYLWDLQSRKVIQTLAGHKDAVLAVATHPSINVIASASLDHDPSIKIWKLKQS